MTNEERKMHNNKISVARKNQINEQQYMFLFDKEFDDLGYQSKRIRVIIEQDAKCQNCGIEETAIAD